MSNRGGPKTERSASVGQRYRTVREEIDSLASKPPLTARWIGCGKSHKQLTTVGRRRIGDRGARGTCASETCRYEDRVSTFTIGQNFLKVFGASCDGALD